MSDRTRDAALASAVMSLSRPGPPLAEELERGSRLVLDEARLELGLRPDDESWGSRSKLREHLSRKVEQRLFSGIDRGALRQRMGATGKLPTSGYHIKLGEVFKDSFKNENGKFAIECVKKADLHQHFLGENAEPFDVQFSFFARLVSSLKRDKKYWVLASALRTGDTLQIMAFWRVFPETVTLDEVQCPRDILERFLMSYGLDLIVAGEQTSERLVVDRLLKGWRDQDNAVNAPLDQPSAKELIAATTDSGIYVGLSYAVDFRAYQADWSRLA